MTYHLYITNKNYSSWSLRPWLLLRQLGIPFVEELQPLISGTFRQPRMYRPTLPHFLPYLALPPYLHCKAAKRATKGQENGGQGHDVRVMS
jgi:glutathione S-transferase